ncbi:hypothetical protein [Tenacibaculum maritimum]|uniref:hypothetical protein n=1 Tax=Tenacibaculum maritimum TaxID=107401 RepID=UPI00388F074A
MKNLIVRPSNSLDIKVQTVKTAYFAKKEIVSTEKTTEAISYTFKGNNNTGTKKRKRKIAKIIYKNLQGKLINKQQTSLEQVVAALSKSNYTKGDCIDIALVKERIKFTKRTSAQLGEEVYIVIQTQYMPDREITLNLKQGGDTDALTTTKEPIYVTQNNKKVFAFKAVVGEFSQKSNALNAADFKDHAIAKITLQSTDQQENKQYKDALNKAEGKTSPFYIAMDAEPANQNWFEVKYEEVFDNRPNLWYYGEGNWFELRESDKINEYHIYQDGKIEKFIYGENNSQNKYKYIYHDSSGKEHEICTVKSNVTKEKKNGVTHKTKPTHSKIESDKTVSEGSTERRVKYINDDIAEYGKHPTKGKIWRLYKAKKNDVELVKMPDSLSYKKDGLSIEYKFSSTKRRYTGPECLAGFIGALADLKTQITTTGSCFSEGSCFPSSEHVNGKSVDTIYKWEKKTDQKIINAMDKFHFAKILVGNKKYFSDFDNCEDGGSLHNSHLHSGDFDKNNVKVIKK